MCIPFKLYVNHRPSTTIFQDLQVYPCHNDRDKYVKENAVPKQHVGFWMPKSPIYFLPSFIHSFICALT